MKFFGYLLGNDCALRDSEGCQLNKSEPWNQKKSGEKEKPFLKHVSGTFLYLEAQKLQIQDIFRKLWGLFLRILIIAYYIP